jgi:hypothetical protein
MISSTRSDCWRNVSKTCATTTGKLAASLCAGMTQEMDGCVRDASGKVGDEFMAAGFCCAHPNAS